MSSLNPLQIALIIPCYRVKSQIVGVLTKALSLEHIEKIIVVDDACPEKTGSFVSNMYKDPRVIVIHNEINLGVGGATIQGIMVAMQTNCEIFVKLDGDGQMNPKQIKNFIHFFQDDKADFLTGSRFETWKDHRGMPAVRLFGNIALTYMSRLSSGYFDVRDPNNGFIALSRSVLCRLPLDKIDHGYFFESDLLHYLYFARARITHFPVKAIYADEQSSLSIIKSIPEFAFKHFRNLFRRYQKMYFHSINKGAISLTSLIFSLILSWLLRNTQADSLFLCFSLVAGFNFFLVEKKMYKDFLGCRRRLR